MKRSFRERRRKSAELPTAAEQWAQYDLVILGKDVERLLDEQATRGRDFVVDQGGHLLSASNLIVSTPRMDAPERILCRWNLSIGKRAAQVRLTYSFGQATLRARGSPLTRWGSIRRRCSPSCRRYIPCSVS